MTFGTDRTMLYTGYDPLINSYQILAGALTVYGTCELQSAGWYNGNSPGYLVPRLL
jgi:hypothetical protein